MFKVTSCLIPSRRVAFSACWLSHHASPTTAQYWLSQSRSTQEGEGPQTQRCALLAIARRFLSMHTKSLGNADLLHCLKLPSKLVAPRQSVEKRVQVAVEF